MNLHKFVDLGAGVFQKANAVYSRPLNSTSLSEI